MAEIEKAFKKSYGICKEHPALFLPYLLKGILNFFIAILLVFSILLTLGIDLSSLSSFNLEDERELSHFLAYLKPAFTPGAVFFILFGIILAVLLFLIINSAAEGATINYAKQIIKGESELSQLSLFEGAKKYALSLFGYTLFISLLNAVIVLIFLLFITLFSFLIPTKAVFLSSFMLFLLIIVLIILNIGALFSPQFIVGEDRGIVSGFRESVGFVFSNIFSVFLYLVVAIFAYLTFAVSVSILSFFSEVFNFLFLKAFASFMVQIFSFLAGVVISVYFETTKTAFVLERTASENREEHENKR